MVSLSTYGKKNKAACINKQQLSCHRLLATICPLFCFSTRWFFVASAWAVDSETFLSSLAVNMLLSLLWLVMLDTDCQASIERGAQQNSLFLFNILSLLSSSLACPVASLKQYCFSSKAATAFDRFHEELLENYRPLSVCFLLPRHPRTVTSQTSFATGFLWRQKRCNWILVHFSRNVCWNTIITTYFNNLLI